MATGASEVMLVNPINFVKFRMQRPEWGYSGMLDAIQTIYRTEGLPAFWKGAGAVFVRNTICNGGMVGGYKLLGSSFIMFHPDLLRSKIASLSLSHYAL